MKKLIPKLLFLNLFFLLVLFSSSISAQQKVTGNVTDAADGTLIPGVAVLVEGTAIGTLTDFDGNYSVDVPVGRNKLVFSMLGFANQTITVGTSSIINVALKSSDTALDEVVVVGYGTQTRSKVTSSIAKVDMKLLETGMRSNPAQALAGTVSGLRVVTATGRPGSVPAIVLRGGTNFDGSGSPL
ncbi:MAG: carboxypeptidase-like regulatory domain-containing protein, partial [Bacteroidota bacterium]|nr:carboxypeptidase-like regulatory domain-containing protein [Bacteroidota bacterium]